MMRQEHAECKVISGSFALLVQAFLAVMVLATLLFKRWRESPQRTLTIWFMDSSKQGFAMGLQHFINIALAVLFAEGEMQAGECIWYITNFTITVFCGLFILKCYMMLHRFIVERYGLTTFRSGEYGEPPSWLVWFAQLSLWCLVSCMEKLITAACVIWPLRNVLDAGIAVIEKPLRPYPQLELVLVMVVLPTLLNMLFAWVVDNLIKDPDLSHDGSSTENDEMEPLKSDRS